MSEAPALPAARQLWLAQVLLDGFAADAAVSVLEAAGTPGEVARVAVDEIVCSPAFLVARRRLRAHRLRRRVATVGRGRVDARPDLDADTFRDVYVAHQVPVHVPGFCADWPCATWTPAELASRFGDVEVDVCVGREAVDAPDRRWREVTTRRTLGSFVADLAGHTGNDLYMIANHRNLDGGLSPLLDEVTPPPGWARREDLPGNVSLWMGPAGTMTPLHHDTSSVMFCQVHGRKRVRLVPPVVDALADGATGFYAGAALDDADAEQVLDGVPVHEVELAPGDMLLLPVGWWHDVLALTPSISVSIVGLPFPNRHDDHVAGAP